MLYFSYFILLISGFLFVFTKNKIAKKIYLITCFCFMFMMLGWAAGAYDVEIGISRYVNYKKYENFTEVGFQWLVTIGHNLNMDYRTFYVILSLFELIIIFWFVLKNSTNPIITLLLFMLFPMIAYFQYTRNILSFSFVIIAIDSLIHKPKLYIVRFLLFVSIASTIHLSSLIFLLYLPLSLLKKKYVVVFCTALVLFLFLGSNISFINEFLVQALGDEKLQIVSGTTEYDGMFGRVSALLVTILEFWILFFVLKFMYKIDLTDRFTHVLFCINALSFVFIPLTLKIGSGFSRIPTLLTLVNYCYFCTMISKLSAQKDRVFSYSFVLVFIAVLFIANFRNAELREALLIPFFEENELVSMLYDIS